MKKTLITIGLTTLVVLTLVGVVSALFTSRVSNTFSTMERSLDYGYGGSAPMEPAMAPMPASEVFVSDVTMGYDSYSEEAVAANVASTERLVIQNVDMSIVVPDPKEEMSKIGNLAVEMGGFVVSSNLYQNTYGPNSIEVPEGSITIRVPSSRLDEALDKVKENAVEVTYENRSGQDVTNQYVDLKSRLAAKQNAEKKLLQIMETAEKAEDVLAIYLQVQNVQTEIEVLKGQIQYYEESAALSAISIRLVAEETTKPIEIGGWKLQGTANQAVEDLIDFTQGFTRFLIRFVLYNLPSLILIAIPLWGAFLGGRALFRRFRKAKPAAKEEEEK